MGMVSHYNTEKLHYSIDSQLASCAVANKGHRGSAVCVCVCVCVCVATGDRLTNQPPGHQSCRAY